MPVYTSIVGKNEELIPSVLQLYSKIGDRIIDVTFGKGNFWKKVDLSYYTFIASDILTGTDCRKLPYPEKDFNMVVFDPPYLHGSKAPILECLDQTYRNNFKGGHGKDFVLQFYFDGMKEANRVLKEGGILLVKCMDQVESGKQCMDHIDIYNMAINHGFIAEDLFILVNQGKPLMRHPFQMHARKNHSYLWVFRKVKEWQNRAI